jgi:exodeoxyribonuclease-5
MLTRDQETALQSIEQFLSAKEGSSFLLEGGAGVGKTFLLGELLKRVHSNAFTRDVVCVAAPTHKAINVLRRKLDAFGVQWCLGFDDYTYNGEDVITGTTAALLGIRPVITDDQTAEVKFGKTHRGILSKCMPKVLLIDEVSMLGKVDFLDLRNTLKNAGSKLIVIGDRGQLPPVKQEAVPFDLFQNKAQLREIVRQVADSAIVTLAWAIRDGKDWHAIEGKGVSRVEYLAESFIEQLGEASCFDTVAGKGMQWLREEDRPVFIAYTNKRVNEIQECATMKLYGHGRLEFAPGELVLSESNLYRQKVMLCANQDELIVDSFMEDARDPTCGVPVVLHHHSDPRKGKFTAHYLSPEEFKDKAHPYNVELEARRAAAEGLSADVKRLPRGSYEWEDANTRRKRAWAGFFDWRDQTVISFRHPFAITSHKSQGSTYKRVFADTADLGRFSMHALYVAVTRPREELILARAG